MGLPIPGDALRIAEDGEVLIKGPTVFASYWGNSAASAEALTDDGWMRTGDLGELDDEGYLRITGRKKEIIVTAGGKNVAPGPLEDRIRAHALISQAMVVGDGRPYVAALVTVDEEAFPPWKERHGKPADATVADLRDDPDLLAEIQTAVDDANGTVSRAESIRRFGIVDDDFSPGERPADPLAQGPPQRGEQGPVGRHRGPLRVAAVRGARRPTSRRSQAGRSPSGGWALVFSLTRLGARRAGSR